MSKRNGKQIDGSGSSAAEAEEVEAVDTPAPAADPIPCPPSHEEDPLMSMSDVARYVGKSPPTITRWVADGLLKAVRVGPLHKIRRSDLARFMSGSALAAREAELSKS